MLLSLVPIWNMEYLCGILIKNIIVLEAAVQRFATKVCVKSWNILDYQERL